MVKVNGQEFETWEQAQEYIEEQKQAEAKAKKEAEMATYLAEARAWLNNHLNVAVVENKDGVYLICSLSDAEDRSNYPVALAEDIFGDQFEVYTDSVHTNYSLSKIKPTVAIKDFIATNHKLYDQNRQSWGKTEIGGTEYKGVFLQDFLFARKDKKCSSCGEETKNLNNTKYIHKEFDSMGEFFSFLDGLFR